MIEDIVYATVDGRPLLADFYPSTVGAKALPLVIWIHGGGWSGGDKRPCLPESLGAHGYATASINYRFTQEAAFPAQLHDCKAAVRFFRANAADYGIDPARIGVAGHSAGGHLAALMGVTAGRADLDGELGPAGVDTAVQAVCDMAGPADLIAMATCAEPSSVKQPGSATERLVGGPILANPERARSASPVSYATAESAPSLILHGDADGLVPVGQARALHGALVAAGADCTLHVVPGGDHVGWEYDEAIHTMMREFFDRHLKR